MIQRRQITYELIDSEMQVSRFVFIIGDCKILYATSLFQSHRMALLILVHSNSWS